LGRAGLRERFATILLHRVETSRTPGGRRHRL